MDHVLGVACRPDQYKLRVPLARLAADLADRDARSDAAYGALASGIALANLISAKAMPGVIANRPFRKPGDSVSIRGCRAY